jgi:hypothetical protein
MKTILPIIFWDCEIWRWRQQGPPKLWYPTTSLRGVNTHNTVTWIVIAVKTSNFTSELFSLLLASLRIPHFVRGPLEKFVVWWQFATVMQNEEVTVMPSSSGGDNVVVGWSSSLYARVWVTAVFKRTLFRTTEQQRWSFEKFVDWKPPVPISSWSLRQKVCSTFSRSGWSVVRSVSLANRGTSKKRQSPRLHKVPTQSNKASPPTFQMALVVAHHSKKGSFKMTAIQILTTVRGMKIMQVLCYPHHNNLA